MGEKNMALNIVTWKWKQPPNPPRNKRKPCEFSARHVNTLYNMVSRHLHIPFNFICITDNPEGIAPDIKVIPIWKDYLNIHGCYVRLKAFSSEMKDILGPKFVSFDLDCVITNDITPLLNVDEDFMIWEDFERRKTPYCGSLWMHKPGTRPDVWEDFNINKSPKEAYNAGFITGTDQAYLSHKFYPDARTWTKEDGIYNFKVHIMKKSIYKYIGKRDIRSKKRKKELIEINNGKLPEDARIVFFNGTNVDPSLPVLQEKYPWIKEHWC